MTTLAPLNDKPLRVMIVDDSATIRSATRKILEDNKNLLVVASAANGKMALDELDSKDIDIIILDIEMPIMDGITALPLMLEKKKELCILISSTLTLRNADISLKCLELGATDYIPKPSGDLNEFVFFKQELMNKMEALGHIYRKKMAMKEPATAESSMPVQKKIALRPMPMFPPKILVFGSSTGGPQALIDALKGLNGKLSVPLLISQHMPPKFTTMLASNIEKSTGIKTFEAEDGMQVQSGCIYLAPGDFHMTLVREGLQDIIRLNQEPHENYCRPSVNPMMRSVAKVYGAYACGFMLTGMGVDGLDGAKAIVDAGGAMFAQDEATSVVWGMPGAVAQAGICSQILPLLDIPHLINKLCISTSKNEV